MNLFWTDFKYSYYKLLLIQAIKLNNIENFNKSQLFLWMIIRRTKKYLFPWILFYLGLNYMKIKFPLNKLLKMKKILTL